MIDWTEIQDGEDWEQFCRDFLNSMGLTILAEPGRGADGGRDLLVAEVMGGKVSSVTQKWLVSCKHYAGSTKSVTPKDEPSIVDRVKQHKADGFMGFYSTIPSNGLIERLRAISENNPINYFVWDGRAIEGNLLNRNQSDLMTRYFPKSFAEIRPIAPLLGERLTLPCEVCGKDALEGSLDGGFNANVVFASDEGNVVQRVLVACKGSCDPILEDRLFKKHGWITAWEDVTDLCNPLLYLRRLFAVLNNIRDNPEVFSDDAFEEVKHLYTVLAQRTLRPPLPSDEKRYNELLMFDGL